MSNEFVNLAIVISIDGFHSSSPIEMHAKKSFSIIIQFSVCNCTVCVACITRIGYPDINMDIF